MRGGGEQPVLAASRRGTQPVRNLALHHHHGPRQQPARSRGEEPQQDRRGDVVWQIANHIRALALRHQRSEIPFENIGLEDFNLRLFSKAKAQFGGQRRIDLDGDQPPAARSQNRCNCAVARADLDHRPLAERAQRVHNRVARFVVNQKVLAEFRLAHHIPFRARMSDVLSVF